MPSYSSKTFIVFAKLSQHLQEVIDTMRKIYNPEGLARWEAHITIKQDEDYSVSSETLYDIVKYEFNALPAIQYSLKSTIVKETPSGKYMVYIPIESPRLKSFVKQLSKKMEPYILPLREDAYKSTQWEQSEDFFLHCTIASNILSIEEAESLAKQVNEAIHLPSHYSVHALFLCNWEKTKWVGRRIDKQ